MREEMDGTRREQLKRKQSFRNLSGNAIAKSGAITCSTSKELKSGQ